MNDRIHAFLDGELPAEALTAAELATARAVQATSDETAAVLREGEIPDLTALVLSRLPDLAPRSVPSRGGLFAWLWGTRTLSFAYRPAYGLAGFAIAGLGAIALLSTPPPPPPVTASAPETRLYIQFRLEAPEASQVRLAGSFTEWQPTVDLVEVGPGVWSALIPLRPGVHDYTFVVDDDQWVVDPYAATVEDSFGGSNSRLFLPAPLAGA